MNFFARAVFKPQLIVDALSVYNNIEDDINSELFQLVYFGRLNYSDVHFMTYKDRKFWIKEVNKILDSQNNMVTTNEFEGFS